MTTTLFGIGDEVLVCGSDTTQRCTVIFLFVDGSITVEDPEDEGLVNLDPHCDSYDVLNLTRLLKNFNELCTI